MTIHNLQIALQAIDFILFFYLVGLLLIRLGVLPKDTVELDKVQLNWRQQLLGCLSLLSVTAVVLLLIRTIVMSGGNVVDSVMLVATVIQQTHYGFIWSIHLTSLLALWALLPLASRGTHNWPTFLMFVISLAIGWTYSAVSHAADQGDFSISEMNDWLHVLTTAIWGGSIIASAGFLFPTLKRLPASSMILIESLKRLSGMLLMTVPLVIVTGLGNIILHTKNYQALLEHTYGHILFVKLLFVGSMLVVGAFNRFKIQLETSHGQIAAKLHVSFKLDVVLLLAAVSFASILIQTMPA